MTHHNRKICSTVLTVASFFILFSLLVCTSGCAEEIPLDVVGHSNDWMGQYLSNETYQGDILPEDPYGITSSQISPISESSGKIWVTISPFTASLSGQTTHLVAGYLSGDRNGATITIAGKNPADTDFSDITTIKSDENGLFIWAVPAGQKDIDLFRVTAKSGSTQIQSNAIRFTASGTDPVIQPVVAPVIVPATSPVQIQTPIPVQPHIEVPVVVVTSSPSRSGATRLTISSPVTDPAVGERFTISGKLTDQDGNGISGATVTIDEEGYSGSDHLNTTQTGSDGSFEFSVGVAYAYTVGFVAAYPGDENYNPAQSNTVTVTAH